MNGMGKRVNKRLFASPVSGRGGWLMGWGNGGSGALSEDDIARVVFFSFVLSTHHNLDCRRQQIKSWQRT